MEGQGWARRQVRPEDLPPLHRAAAHACTRFWSPTSLSGVGAGSPGRCTSSLHRTGEGRTAWEGLPSLHVPHQWASGSHTCPLGTGAKQGFGQGCPWTPRLASPPSRFRASCQKIIAHKMFDHVVLLFIFLNCITIALERPDIDPESTVRPLLCGERGGVSWVWPAPPNDLSLQERVFLSVSNYIFTAIFVAEMMVKVGTSVSRRAPGSVL